MVMSGTLSWLWLKRHHVCTQRGNPMHLRTSPILILILDQRNIPSPSCKRLVSPTLMLPHRSSPVSPMPIPTGYEPLLTLKPVAPDLWICDGPHISFYGLPFPTRMTIVRLADGGLFVHSPVTLTADPGEGSDTSGPVVADRDDRIGPNGGLRAQTGASMVQARGEGVRAKGLEAEVAALGPVRHLIAPNWIHYAHLPAWQRAFPGSTTWAAPGVRERAASYGVDLRIDEPLGDEAPPAWKGQIDQVLVRGSDIHQEVVFFHRPSRTLILTDLIENFESHHCPAWTRPLLALAGTRDPDGKAPIDMRFSFRIGENGQGMDLLRAAIERMLAWDPERVILAHGRWYPTHGTAELRRAFRWAIP